MKRLMEKLLWRRAERLVRFMLPQLPSEGPILDVGSGTGHNAERLIDISLLDVIETDIVDMHSVGRGPILFDGNTLPFPNATFSASILLFVLHYAPDPVSLLTEMRRVTSGQVLVLQSTYSGKFGRWFLRTREFISGRFAFFVAGVVGLVSTRTCSLRPRRFFTRQRLEEILRESGFRVHEVHHFDAVNVLVSRDLYVLEPIAPCPLPYRS